MQYRKQKTLGHLTRVPEVKIEITDEGNVIMSGPKGSFIRAVRLMVRVPEAWTDEKIAAHLNDRYRGLFMSVGGVIWL